MIRHPSKPTMCVISFCHCLIYHIYRASPTTYLITHHFPSSLYLKAIALELYGFSGLAPGRLPHLGPVVTILLRSQVFAVDSVYG